MPNPSPSGPALRSEWGDLHRSPASDGTFEGAQPWSIQKTLPHPGRSLNDVPREPMEPVPGDWQRQVPSTMQAAPTDVARYTRPRPPAAASTTCAAASTACTKSRALSCVQVHHAATAKRLPGECHAPQYVLSSKRCIAACCPDRKSTL